RRGRTSARGRSSRSTPATDGFAPPAGRGARASASTPPPSGAGTQASPASSAPRSTATARSRGPTSSSSGRLLHPAFPSSPPAACGRPRTSPRSPRPERRLRSSAGRSSGGDQGEIRLQRGEIEPVRRLPRLIEEVDAQDGVDLVDVAVPERPRQLLEPPPGDDREGGSVVADDVDCMPAPRAGLRRAVEPVRPVPGRLVLRRQRQLDADVEPAEEECGARDEAVTPGGHGREGPDRVAADAALAPVAEDFELDGSLLAGRRVDLLDLVEGQQHRALAHLDRMAA